MKGLVMSFDLTIIGVAKSVAKEAHQQYLDTWTLMTEIAENNGVQTPEVQHRILKLVQENASSIDLLAQTLADYLEKNNDKTTY